MELGKDYIPCFCSKCKGAFVSRWTVARHKPAAGSTEADYDSVSDHAVQFIQPRATNPFSDSNSNSSEEGPPEKLFSINSEAVRCNKNYMYLIYDRVYFLYTCIYNVHQLMYCTLIL